MVDLGVDFSQWGGVLAPATVECWKGSGVKFAVVQYSERMRQHLDALQAAGGVDLEAYVYLYWGEDPWHQTPQGRTRNALNMAGGRIKRLWLDAEDSTHPYDEGQLAECVQICEAAGVPAGIYTGRWWWQPMTGDSRAFMHLPLWHAEYKPPNFDAFQSYGGWQRPALWQYQGTTTLCGHSVDLNVREEVAPAPVPVPVPVPVPEPHDKGIFVEGDFVNVYNGPPFPVVRFGGRDFPGRISKLFGDKYLWLRIGENGAAYWSEIEGD